MCVYFHRIKRAHNKWKWNYCISCRMLAFTLFTLTMSICHTTVTNCFLYYLHSYIHHHEGTCFSVQHSSGCEYFCCCCCCCYCFLCCFCSVFVFGLLISTFEKCRIREYIVHDIRVSFFMEFFKWKQRCKIQHLELLDVQSRKYAKYRVQSPKKFETFLDFILTFYCE